METFTNSSGTFKYTIIKSWRSQGIHIRIKGSDVTVVVPLLVPQVIIRSFVTSHAQWVLSQLEKNAIRNRITLSVSKEDYDANKLKVTRWLRKKVEYYNADYGYMFHAISVRRQKTVWGSCSGKATLQFNFALSLLPEPYVDYVVVHELCHLKEMNHSENFWKLVEQKIPNHRNIRKELKRYDITLS